MGHRPDAEEIIATIGDPEQYEQIVFCGYVEPTLRLKLLLQVARWINEHGGQVRVNTEGLANLVHKHDVLLGLVDTLSVSMNVQDKTLYERHCQPNLSGSYHCSLPAYIV